MVVVLGSSIIFILLLIGTTDNVTSYLDLQYDLKSGSEYEYLNWFHNIHIPEKCFGQLFMGSLFRDRLRLLTKVKIEDLILHFFWGMTGKPSLTQVLLNAACTQDALTKEMENVFHLKERSSPLNGA